MNLTLTEALQIAVSKNATDDRIWGACETADKYLFTVGTEKQIKSYDFDQNHYLFYVNKSTRDTGWMSFFEYADAVDAGLVSEIEDLPIETRAS